MKLLIKIWLITTSILLIIVAVNLLDTYISLKYEIDEPKAMIKISEIFIEKEKYIKNSIVWFWVFGAYLLLNILFCTKLLLKAK